MIFRCIIASLCLFSLWGQVNAAPPAAKTKIFKGAWFGIRYPANFNAHIGLHSATAADGCDSAFFVSPDKMAAFYVYSPQWNGEPKDYVVDPKKEVVVDTKQQTVKQGSENLKSDIRTVWITVRAKDNSYYRSLVDVENVTLNVRKVFGIKYANSSTYAKYKPQFEAFKKSLEQFAD